MADNRSGQQNMRIHRSIDVPMYNIYKRLLRAFDIDAGVVVASSPHCAHRILALARQTNGTKVRRELDQKLSLQRESSILTLPC